MNKEMHSIVDRAYVKSKLKQSQRCFSDCQFLPYVTIRLNGVDSVFSTILAYIYLSFS